LADDRGWLFTGRLSLESHPWLGDHAVMGTVLLPGTAFLELALAAAEQIGAGVLDELTLEKPLLLRDEDTVQIQLSVSDPDESGRCQLAIYSRPQSSSAYEPEREQWSCHATGVLMASEDVPAGAQGPLAEELESLADKPWPPEGAQELAVEFLYDRLAEAGYNYGPAFQGLHRAWQLGDELYAEIALDEEQPSQAASFCIHPALLDMALHTLALEAFGQEKASEVEVLLSSASGVHLYGRGADALRVRLRSAKGQDAGAGSLSLIALDATGAPALCIDSLLTRAIHPSQLKAARRTEHDALYELQWVEAGLPSPNGSQLHLAVLGGAGDIQAEGIEMERYSDLKALQEAIEQGASPPELVLVQAQAMAEHTEAQAKVGQPLTMPAGNELKEAIRQITERTLELLKAWLASEQLLQARLVLITEGALACGADEAPNLTQAALVGLLRSAQSEHPGCFGLIDIDGGAVGLNALYGALVSEEPELCLRQGTIYAPRLSHLKAKEHAESPPLDRHGTTLISGGTGGLGALLARHLAAGDGAGRLLLISRSGAKANGAQELAASLKELGCDAQIAVCDVSDREQLKALIASIPEEHPLTAVIHTAGTLNDGVISSLDGERLARVMAPKVDGAINLHELTAHAELREFILYSSASAILGIPGQGNYAAANTFLDALAAHRRANGLPGMSLAWGAWEQATGITAGLSEADHARFERMGLTPLSDEQGLELIDIARSIDEPLLVPVRLDKAALRCQAEAGTLPAILRGLVRAPARRAANAQGSLARRLAGAPESDWDAIVLELVLSHVAGVLGHASAEAIDPQRPFKEAGFDSLGAVELRNRLGQSTGLGLASTLIFDYPTPAAVAGYLRSRVADDETVRSAIDEALDRLKTMLASVAADDGERVQIEARLRSFNTYLASFLASVSDGDFAGEDRASDDDLASASDDELFGVIEREFGSS
jgi:acyl transferase domain-containing protein/acyl carrier protein